MPWNNGDRVRVHAGPNEGTDYDWHGERGAVVRDHENGWVEIRFDKKLAHWPSRQTTIVHHNVVAE